MFVERDGAGCFYCGSIFAEHVDHVVPVKARKRLSWVKREEAGIDGLRLACRPCNASKGDRPVSEFVAMLAKSGRATQRAVDAYG